MAWLQSHCVYPELLQLLKYNKSLRPKYTINELAQEHDHKIIRTLPYHCQYDAIIDDLGSSLRLIKNVFLNIIIKKGTYKQYI